MAPAGAPGAVVTEVNGELARALTQRELADRIAALGADLGEGCRSGLPSTGTPTFPSGAGIRSSCSRMGEIASVSDCRKAQRTWFNVANRRIPR